MDRTEKNRQIGETRRATLARHEKMLCRCFEVKIDYSKLSRKRRKEVNLLFREAKWFRNAYIADMKGVTDKDKTVKVKVGDEFEDRDIAILGSQIRQSIISGVKDSLKSLKALKDNGHKVGSLKFKSVCNCVE